jgi:uncharacterized protein YccT (UPF0319 family)
MGLLQENAKKSRSIAANEKALENRQLFFSLKTKNSAARYNGADQDVSVTRLQFKAMFANGFE